MRQKTETIQIRLSAEEKTAIETAAQANGRSVSDWTRRTLLEAAGTDPQAELRKAMEAAKARYLGTNLGPLPDQPWIVPFHQRVAPNGPRSQNPLMQEPALLKPPVTRGTRLPANWQLPDDWGLWAAREHGFASGQVIEMAYRFRDYWIAKAGKDATKMDWEATWRNWVRKEGLTARKMGHRAQFAKEIWGTNEPDITGNSERIL